MDIVKFIKLRPFLYHLTDERNVNCIVDQRKILSTKEIVTISSMLGKQKYLTSRRDDHSVINVNGKDYYIRDQQPISEKVLGRSLNGNWTVADFIELLNKRVFFWPTIGRLTKHFNRYQNEKPVIFRFRTDEILALNKRVEFCRLNSGATRCSSYWAGDAPHRGSDTFLEAASYELNPGTVAEVTIPDYCILPSEYWVSNNPNNGWIHKKF